MAAPRAATRGCGVVSQIRSPHTTAGREAILVLATQAGLVVVGLAVESLITYALLPEGRGAYAVCTMFGVLFGILFTPGADRATQHFVMAKRLSVSQGFSLASAICLGGAALGSVVALLLMHSDIAFFQKATTRSFYFALPLIVLTAYSTALHLQLAGLRRFSSIAMFFFLQSATNVILILTLVWGLDLGVDGAIVSLAAARIVFIASCVRYLRRHHGLVAELPTRSGLRAVLAYGVKGYVSRTGHAVEQRVGVLFLGMYASQADIGLFAVSMALMIRVLIIPDSTATVVLPRVAADPEGRPDLVTFCVRGAYWITGGVLVAFLLTSTWVVEVLFSRAFLPMVRLLWIMAPGIVAAAGATVIMAFFRGANRPEICSWAIGLGLSANIMALLMLYPSLGLDGAAWAMTIGLVARSAFLVAAFRKVARIAWRDLWLPQRADGYRLWSLGTDALGRSRRRDGPHA